MTIVNLLNVIGLIMFLTKTFSHIYLAKKYGRNLRVGHMNTSYEMFMFYKSEVKEEDRFLKKVVNWSYLLFFISYLLGSIMQIWVE